jgi:hypothetical protein
MRPQFLRQARKPAWEEPSVPRGASPMNASPMRATAAAGAVGDRGRSLVQIRTAKTPAAVQPSVITRTPTFVTAPVGAALTLQNRVVTIPGAVTFIGAVTTEFGGGVDPTQLR